MVSYYNKNTINYTVEKGLVDLDTIIETPENELVDKEEKLKDLKEVSAKLLTTDKGMEVVKEIAVEVERLKKEVGKPKTTRKRRRRR
jgi:predicted RecB family endonuclease